MFKNSYKSISESYQNLAYVTPISLTKPTYIPTHKHNTKIIFNFTNIAGFFSVLHFFFTIYIYCRKNNLSIYIIDNKWMFKNKNGIDDYFILNKYIIKEKEGKNKNENILELGHDFTYNDVNKKKYGFTVSEYIFYIKEFYILNDIVKNKLNNYIKNIKLPLKYVSIFVRWGDKITSGESKYINPEKYINFLSEKSKNNNIFIHSDDHNEILKYKELLKNKKYNIYFITSDEDKGGAVVGSKYKKDFLKNKLSVDSMNNLQKRDHTEKMLCAIEIMKKSELVVLDFQSNVSRFLKLYCECPVYDIFGKDLKMNDIIHPAYAGFE
jgi:hypothetical protein